MARPQYLFVAVQGELQVYRLDRTPTKDAKELRKRQVETARTVSEVAEKLQAFRREQVESGCLFGDKYFGENAYRPDKKGKQQDDVKTHYTPSVLVEFVLSHILPEERLATPPRILDPACGSGIFLVEAFRRIVRYQVKQQRGKMPTPEALRQILKEQIRGNCQERSKEK